MKRIYTAMEHQVINVAKHVNFRHHRSQPMPKGYSRFFAASLSQPAPNAMQQAFLNALVR